MNLLLGTHLLIWAAADSPRLSQAARVPMRTPENERFFSVCSPWEIAIKAGRGRKDLLVDGAELRTGLLANGYREMPVRGEHALPIPRLPPVHEDPFDRLLVAQAMVEGLTPPTSDDIVARYLAAIARV
jgi:PIN domain nuclease of toxin-antitoxin system